MAGQRVLITLQSIGLLTASSNDAIIKATVNNKERNLEKVLFNTKGDGYWSNVAKTVEITDMKLGYIDDEGDFGELRVYFNTDTWDVNVDGLIYTDSQFKIDLMQFIEQHGLVVDLCYSEQGMQGDDYVSLDVGKDFLDSWAAKFGRLTV